MDLDTTMVVADVRMACGEDRHRAVGLIDGRLHVMVFAMRGQAVRVISLRKANDRERREFDAGRS
jgi:uncharacterized DUF497 family protein